MDLFSGIATEGTVSPSMADIDGATDSGIVQAADFTDTRGQSRSNETDAELTARFEVGFDPSRSISARDEEMTPPAGYFVVAWLDGGPVGCGALKVGDGVTGEIKRMWTAPSARGLGIARKVLRTLEAKAREAGLTRLHLETNRALTEARALYRQEGYQEVAPFNTEPYAHHWFEKRL